MAGASAESQGAGPTAGAVGSRNPPGHSAYASRLGTGDRHPHAPGRFSPGAQAGTGEHPLALPRALPPHPQPPGARARLDKTRAEARALRWPFASIFKFTFALVSSRQTPSNYHESAYRKIFVNSACGSRVSLDLRRRRTKASGRFRTRQRECLPRQGMDYTCQPPRNNPAEMGLNG